MISFSSKRFLLPLLVAGGIVFSACSGKNTKGDAEALQQDNADAQAVIDDNNVKKPEWSVSGNTLTYGTHTYTMQGDFDKEYVSGGKAKVTFTNVPSDYDEFRTVYEQLLGKTSYGVSAMLPMAFEMWGRDHAMGEQCLTLITGGTCYNEIMRQLPDHMVASEYAPAGDGYAQRCLPAAVLEGANKENGYNPTEPYTVNMTIGLQNTWGEESEILQAYCYKLNIISGNAWNTTQRPVTVMLPWRGEQLYKVNNCSSLYVNIFVPRQDWDGLK